MSQNMVATGGNNQIDTSKLGSLLDQALGLEKESGQQQDVVVEKVEAQKPVEQIVEQTTTVEQVKEEPTIWEPPPGAKVKVTLDGKEELVSVDDYRNSLQREAIFTQRMQALASQRKAAEEELTNRWAQLQLQAQAIQAAQNQRKEPSLVEQLQELATKQNQRTPKPDEVVTHGEVQQTVSQQIDALKKLIEDTNSKSQQDSESKIAQAIGLLQKQAQADRFTNGLQQVLAKPELQILTKVNPQPGYVEAVVRSELGKMDIGSMEQGWQMAEMVAKQWAANIRKEFVGEQKVEAAKVAKQQLEPSTSGSAPGPKKNSYETIFKKDGSINWNVLGQRAHAIADSLDA